MTRPRRCPTGTCAARYVRIVVRHDDVAEEWHVVVCDRCPALYGERRAPVTHDPDETPAVTPRPTMNPPAGLDWQADAGDAPQWSDPVDHRPPPTAVRRPRRPSGRYGPGDDTT